MRAIIDAHLDLAWNAVQWNRDLTRPLDAVRQAEAHMTDHAARRHGTVCIPELRRGRIAICVATLLARCKPEHRPAAGFKRRELDFADPSLAHAMAHGQLAYYKLLEKQRQVRILRTAGDVRRHWAAWSAAAAPDAQPPGLIVTMEGADPIVSPEDAQEWFAAGLRCVGMAHYGQGRYAMGTGGQGPLTPAGRELLKALRRVGMLVDLTHCAEPGFFEVLDRFEGPVHASHNMCRALVPGDRQFSDEQIRRLIERGAVIGMACDAWMLVAGWTIGQTSRQCASLENVADHIDHICQLAGSAAHAGIGSDLDGGFGTEQVPRELDSIADLQKLAAILARRGYPEADIDGIFHGNWLRFFTRSLPEEGTEHE